MKQDFVMGNFYKYIFVSHSSKDWEKVRIIRNYIENLKFYPLLFHLKCLEKDPLLHKDVIRLKRILKEEIASRGRFLLCNSENSKKSEFVNWEIREVKKYSNIIVEEINIDDPMPLIKSQLKNWITKLNTIAFIHTWKGSGFKYKMMSKLTQLDDELKFVDFADDDHIPSFNGALPHDALDYINEQCRRLSNASIIVPLITDDYYTRGFCSRAEYAACQTYRSVVVPVDLKDLSNGRLGFQTEYTCSGDSEIDDSLVEIACGKILAELYR